MRNIRKTILVVDDKPERLEMSRKTLEGRYNIVAAENGRRALDYLWKNFKDISLVITDVQMPVMDGLELLKTIRSTQNFEKLPVLVIVAAGERENEVKAMDSGASDIVVRPFYGPVLKNRVANILLTATKTLCRNVMEDIVEEGIDECIDSLGICTCPTCRRDLTALVLNRMRPKYVNTDKGELMSKVDELSSATKISMISTIATCAEIIKKNPSHVL